MGRRDEFLRHLAQVPLFSACSKRELDLVARRAEEIGVDAGREVVSQGEMGHEFFAILSGKADVVRNGRAVATLGPGDAFGELSLLDKHPRNASIIAKEPMELIVLGQREFAGLIDDVPGFARKLLAALAARVRAGDARTVH